MALMGVVFVVVFAVFVSISLSDIIKKKKSSEEQNKDKETIEALTKQLHEEKAALLEQEKIAKEKYSKDIEKLKEESELFKKDSFEARLEAQNLDKELATVRSAHKLLSLEHQALKEQLASMENAQLKAQAGTQAVVDDFQKTREGLEVQYRRSLDECEKLKKDFEDFRNGAALARDVLEKKCQDLGYHKVAFEQLSQEHELLRRQLINLQEVHKSDQATVEELNKKLEFVEKTLAAEEEIQQDTEKLEQLLEKQIAVQKKRAAELLALQEENKILKEQLADLKRRSS